MDVSRDSYRSDGLLAYAVFIIMLGVYVATLAPTITPDSSGQQIVAAHHLGVGRTPGYPIWHLLAKGFTMAFPFAEYRGHPNPAWAVNFMSAFFGAAACAVLALVVARAYRGWAVHVAAFSSALIFGFSPAMWSQSVIAETHTLTVFYFLLFLFVLLRWLESGRRHGECVVAFMTGFGLAFSHMMALMVPVILWVAWLADRRALLRIGVATLLFAAVLAPACMFKPSFHALAWIYGGAMSLALAAALFRPTRGVAVAFLLLMIGILPYIYLPLAGSHNAPMSMGHPGTSEGFWHVIHRGQYERMTMAPWYLFPAHVALYTRMCVQQFTWPILLLIIPALIALPFAGRKVPGAASVLALAFVLFGPITLMGVNPRPDIQTQFIARVIFIPSFALLAIGMGLGCASLLGLLDQIPRRLPTIGKQPSKNFQ